MSKTPVSMLQEIMVKKGMVPNYELIYDGGGTHINTFTYQVLCDGLSATGTGRCKKDAKHEAASAMLTTIAAHRNYLQLPASQAQSPVRTPLPDTIPVSPKKSANVPFVNAIGTLQDLCAENNLQEPEYTPISDIGPPHARVFTIRCSVSHFIEDGVGTTKKQAKQEAAKKMIDKINNLVNEMNLCDNSKLSDEQVKLTTDMAKMQYPMLSKVPTTKKVNLGVKLTDYHNVLKDSMDTELRYKMVKKLRNLIPNNFDDDLTDESVMEKYVQFSNLMSEIEVIVTLKDLDDVKNTEESEVYSNLKKIYFIKGMQLDTCPPLQQIEIGETEAEVVFKLLSNMINFLISLLL